MIARFRPLKKTIIAISFGACAFFGIEGGYQLHLSHDHPPLRCAELTLASAAGNSIDGPPSLLAVPPCLEPDEIGEGWRLGLVLRDMLGFLIFGTLCVAQSKQLIATEIAGGA